MAENDPAAVRQSEPVPIIDYAGPRQPPRYVQLRLLGVTEAELAVAKLQSEGIRAYVDGPNSALVHLYEQGNVKLMVWEEDREAAEAILSAPAEVDDDGDYADENWRCPKCHKRKIDLLPLSPGWRRLRLTGVLLLVVPILLCLLDSGFGSNVAKDIPAIVFVVWILGLGGIATSFLWAKRTRHCHDCGHEWTGRPE